MAGSCTVDVTLISYDVAGAVVERFTDFVEAVAVVVVVLIEIGVFAGRLVVGCRVDFVCGVDMTLRK